MSAHSGPQSNISRFQVVDDLNAEWDAIAHTPRVEVQAWAGRHSVMVGCSCLADVLDAALDCRDDVLAALLLENANGAQLAGRVVLQLMVGKIVRLAMRDPSAGAGDYAGAVWCCISDYPLSTRPSRIAANLALDALKSVKREQHWGRPWVVVAVLPDGPLMEELGAQARDRTEGDHNAEVAGLSAADVITTADRLGLIDGKTQAVLRSVYSDGLSGRDAADRHQTTAGMVRHRCSKAVRRLARHADQLVEAA